MPSFTIFIFLQNKDILLHISLKRKVANKHPKPTLVLTCQKIWNQQDFSSQPVFILTTVSQSHCPEDAENESIHQWRRKKDLLIGLIYISQTNKNNSCVFQAYNFYIHTLFLLYAPTITYWVIYKHSYCPISQNHWITDACSELTCWLESTRTWFQLNTATHCGTRVPRSAPPWQ